MSKFHLSLLLSFTFFFNQLYTPLIYAQTTQQITPTPETTEKNDPFAGTETGIQNAGSQTVENDEIIVEIPEFHQTSLSHLTVLAEYVMLIAISGIAGLLFSACPKAIAVPSVAIFLTASITWLMREVYCIVKYKELTEEAKGEFKGVINKDQQLQITALKAMRDNTKELRDLFKQKMITAAIWSAGFAAAFGAVIVEYAAYMFSKAKYEASYLAFKGSSTALKAAGKVAMTAMDEETGLLLTASAEAGDAIDLDTQLVDTPEVAPDFSGEAEKEADECNEATQETAYLGVLATNSAQIKAKAMPQTKFAASAAIDGHIALTTSMKSFHKLLVLTKQWTVMRCFPYCVSKTMMAKDNYQESLNQLLTALSDLILTRAKASPPQEWMKVFTIFAGATGFLYFVKEYRDAASKVWKKPATRLVAFGFFAANAALMAAMIKKQYEDLKQRVEDYDEAIEEMSNVKFNQTDSGGSQTSSNNVNNYNRSGQQYTGTGQAVNPERAADYVGNEGAKGCLQASKEEQDNFGNIDPDCKCLNASNCTEAPEIEIPEPKGRPYFQTPELKTLTNAMRSMGNEYAKGNGKEAFAIANSDEVKKAAAHMREKVANLKEKLKEGDPKEGREPFDLKKELSDFRDKEVAKFTEDPKTLEGMDQYAGFSEIPLDFEESSEISETIPEIDLEDDNDNESNSEEKGKENESELLINDLSMDDDGFPKYIEPVITDEMRRKAAENFDFHDINPVSKPIFDIISRKYQMVFFYQRKLIKETKEKEEEGKNDEEGNSEKLEELDSFLIE